MTSREVLLSYFEVASSLDAIKDFEYDDETKIIEFKIIRHQEIKVFIDLESYQEYNNICLILSRNESDIGKLEITKTLWNLNGNEKQDFKTILCEINNFSKLIIRVCY